MTTNVLVLYPEDPGEELLDQVRAVDDGVIVRYCFYEEPIDVRSAKRGHQPFVPPEVSDDLAAALAEADVILALDLPMDMAVRAPRLRWLQAVSAGIDQLPPVGLSPRVVVTNAKGLRDVPIAEFVIARVLGVWKRWDDLTERQRAHTWVGAHGRTLSGCAMVVVGLGSIGAAVATRANALGMRVTGVRRHPSPHPACVDVVGTDRFPEILGDADVVVSTVPATADTADLFDDAAFAAMKPGATFCNIARGSVVDEDALVRHLGSGHLGTAILDVVKDEPLTPASPLWDAQGLLLSPHSSGASDGNGGMFALFADNLARFIAGRELRNVVDLTEGY